jgi:hypothetical protein
LPTTATSDPQTPVAQTTVQTNSPWGKKGIKITPYGALQANVDYNTSAVVTGSFASFVVPRVLSNQQQFNISAGNTFLGL